MSDFITRKEAKEKNLTTYFTGVPCKHGHVSVRKVANGVCTKCASLVTKRWREEGKKQEMYTAKILPDVCYLQECFTITDCKLYWKHRPVEHFRSSKAHAIYTAKYAGKLAGYRNSRNHYLEVRLDGVLHKGHRIIYKMLTGIEPLFMIDHIDGDPTNDDINNLREANSQQNARNANVRRNKTMSEYKGVVFYNGNWYSTVTVNDKSELVLAESELQAAQDYNERVRKLFGDFAKGNIKEEL